MDLEHWRGTEPVRMIGPGTLRGAGAGPGESAADLPIDDLRDLLRWMLAARRLDRECIALQRQGELTIYPGLEGQEAAQVGSATALGPDDFVFPTFRELGIALVRGIDPVRYLWYHRGTWHGGPWDPLEQRFAPICIPVATQLAHAVGWAMGQRRDATGAVALACFGDGAASEGDFHEAANLAGVTRAPVVLFCQNNGWAISVPASAQTAGEIWRRAEGYGFPGVRVDGNDVLAVRTVVGRAVERARRGEGPTLVEAMTYRLGAHSTADDPRRYRDGAEVERARAWDPIERYRAWLVERGHADDETIAGYERAASELAGRVRAGIVAAEPPGPEAMFDWVYERLPGPLARQHREALGVETHA